METIFLLLIFTYLRLYLKSHYEESHKEVLAHRYLPES